MWQTLAVIKPTMGMFDSTHKNGDDLGMIYGIKYASHNEHLLANPLVRHASHATEICQRGSAFLPFRCLWRISSIR